MDATCSWRDTTEATLRDLEAWHSGAAQRNLDQVGGRLDPENSLSEEEVRHARDLASTLPWRWHAYEFVAVDNNDVPGRRGVTIDQIGDPIPGSVMAAVSFDLCRDHGELNLYVSVEGRDEVDLVSVCRDVTNAFEHIRAWWRDELSRARLWLAKN